MRWEVFESHKQEKGVREFGLQFCEQMDVEINRLKLYLRDDGTLVLVDKQGNVLYTYKAEG